MRLRDSSRVSSLSAKNSIVIRAQAREGRDLLFRLSTRFRPAPEWRCLGPKHKIPACAHSCPG